MPLHVSVTVMHVLCIIVVIYFTSKEIWIHSLHIGLEYSFILNDKDFVKIIYILLICTQFRWTIENKDCCTNFLFQCTFLYMQILLEKLGPMRLKNEFKFAVKCKMWSCEWRNQLYQLYLFMCFFHFLILEEAHAANENSLA